MKKIESVYGFRLTGKVLLLAVFFALYSAGMNGEISEEKSIEVRKRLKMLNKPAVKSIKSEDGDMIDCVDIYRQPAFDHPAMENHTIQMEPSDESPTLEPSKNTSESATTVISQVWHKSGSCPKGTIPIRRVRKEDLLGAGSLESYGRKNPYVPDTTHKKINEKRLEHFPEVNRSVTYLITQGYSYIGARGDINVWNPSLESQDEYSSAQIWLRNGLPQNYESVESGWVVNPKVYGDMQTRLFAYWTADSSTKTGCFDLTCSGFVQTSHEIALGASIDPVSSRFGNQYKISIYLYQDSNTGNWWLQFGERINIGYWPARLFSLLTHSALYVMWGGEVYSSKIKTSPHTTTQMGSGYYAEGLFGSGCFINNIRIRDYSMSLKFPDWIASASEEVYCYHATIYRPGYLSEPNFYFGGPGRNPSCP
ncbi:hypothetical protein IFM89_008436 [Coptis chinensis]|uniref:Neprosin PEP catalytic domain-containing protein n=1 Tax=Coptis chinensis TaxID=261450 RepID=A0A835IB00_9MAGN|nr:hypothetical protein IFM89_008436 [Coptis chinensis]